MAKEQERIQVEVRDNIKHPEENLFQILEAEIDDCIIFVYRQDDNQLLGGVRGPTHKEMETEIKKLVAETECYYIAVHIQDIYIPGTKH